MFLMDSITMLKEIKTISMVIRIEFREMKILLKETATQLMVMPTLTWEESIEK